MTKNNLRYNFVLVYYALSGLFTDKGAGKTFVCTVCFLRVMIGQM